MVTSYSVHLCPITFLRQRHWPDLSSHNMSTAPPWSHWQPAKDSNSNLKTNSPTDWNPFIAKHAEEDFFLLYLSIWQPRASLVANPKNRSRSSLCTLKLFCDMHTVQCPTLAAKVILFLEQEVSVLAGVARVSVHVWLAVTVPTFLMHTNKSLRQTGVNLDYNLNDSLMKMCLSLPGSHLLTLSNTTQSPFHITATVWNEGR